MFERVVHVSTEKLRDNIIELIKEVDDIDLLDLVYKLLLTEG